MMSLGRSGSRPSVRAPLLVTLMSTASTPIGVLELCLKVYQPLSETVAYADTRWPGPVGIVAGAHQELAGIGRVRADVEDEVSAVSAGRVAEG